MADIAELGIKVLSDDIVKAVKRLDKLEDQSKSNERQNKKLGTSFGALKRAIAIVGVGVLTKQLISSINTYTALSNKLKLVTKDAQNLANVQSMLFDVAQDTRASLEGTIDLYSRLARSTKDLGLSQNELADVTETINQAIAVSGSTAQEANAAIFQLGQGLSAGALRGEELNSVLEQTPRLAQAMADGLGVGIAELRTMGSEGKLNAEAVIKALKSQSEVIADEFSQTEKTISQAFQQIENAALKTFGSIEGGGLVDALDEFRETISDPAVVKGLQTLATGIITLTSSMIGLAAAIPNLGERIGKDLANLFDTRELSPIEKLLDDIKLLEVVQSRAAMGSDNWKNSTDQLTESYKKLKEIGGSLAPALVGTGGDEADTGAGDGETPRSKAKQAELERIAEMEAEANFDRIIREQEEMERLSDYNEEKLAIQMDYYDRLYNLETGSQQAALDFAEAIRNSDVKGAIDNGSLMLSNAAKTSKKAFEVQKAFSLAKAVATLPSAVIDSFNNGGGYPWGLIPAALMTAAGIQQINAIKSSSFGGGGSVPNVSGGSTSPSAPVVSGLPPGTTATPGGLEQPQPTVNELRVTVEGDGPHSEGMRKFAENLAETIKDMGGVNQLVLS